MTRSDRPAPVQNASAMTTRLEQHGIVDSSRLIPVATDARGSHVVAEPASAARVRDPNGKVRVQNHAREICLGVLVRSGSRSSPASCQLTWFAQQS
jgi:hypothetical protein